ncbi:MAG: signal peptidase I, partial [Clostridiales bacterium]|nr:signal peptidase I [Clostridiales bacterium]
MAVLKLLAAQGTVLNGNGCTHENKGKLVFPLNWKAIKEWVVLFVIAITIAMFLRTFIVEPRYVPTPSMVPTIRVDDRLYVEKLTPRFGTLRRGMIVTFLAPEQTGRDDYLVKRLIGLG